MGMYGNVKGRVKDLDGDKPTPHAFLAADPFFGTHQRVMGDLNVADRFTATPAANLTDHASAKANSIGSAIRNIPRIWSTTITTINRTVSKFVKGDRGLTRAGVLCSGWRLC